MIPALVAAGKNTRNAVDREVAFKGNPGHPCVNEIMMMGVHDLAQVALFQPVVKSHLKIQECLYIVIYQQLTKGDLESKRQLILPSELDNFYPVIGAWAIDRYAGDMGIRESRNLFEDNRSS
jgi:hypothetical protein